MNSKCWLAVALLTNFFFLIFRANGFVFYPPSFQPAYRNWYKPRQLRQPQTKYRRYDSYKRAPYLDRLSMGLIKRAGSSPSTFLQSEPYFSKQDSLDDVLDLISSPVDQHGFKDEIHMRRKRSVNDDDIDTIIEQGTGQTLDSSTPLQELQDASEKGGTKDIGADSDNTRGHSIIDSQILDKSVVNKENGNTDDKRALDRLHSGFVKKDDAENDLEEAIDKSSDWYQEKDLEELPLEALEVDDKRNLDRLSMGFVKKDDADKRALDRLAYGFVKKDDGVKRLDRLSMGFVKKSEKDKRNLDRLSMGFVKKDTKNKRNLDRLSMGFVKKDDDSKRALDRLSYGFVKKGLDRLSMGFVKKDGVDKRRLDRLSSGFVKKDDSEKRNFDRLSMGFVKKDDIDKRRLDRLSSGFVKKDLSDSDLNKRRIDRLASGFVKKNVAYKLGENVNDQEGNQMDGEYINKRFLDRLNSGLVKKDIETDKRYIDRLSSGFVKKMDDGEKRGLDRLRSGFIKKDQSKRYLDRLNSGFVKRRGLDRLSSGFIKRDSQSKRELDRLSSDFVKRSVYDSDTTEEHPKKVRRGAFHRMSNEMPRFRRTPWYHERSRLDRIGFGLIKRQNSFGQVEDGIPTLSAGERDANNYMGVSDLIKRQYETETSFMNGNPQK